jgi:sigma-B regulation protein RsbU (phosphoserine phosphatase)
MLKKGNSGENTLQCMEIWGGIEPVERAVTTPGLDLWVFSQPFGGDQHGGDVYYVTLCGGGLITRIVVADVSGHGAAVAEFSSSLRSLLRTNINQKSQNRLVERLNRQFADMAEMQRFATALVVTYLASIQRLSVCNAGHPRPLYYHAKSGAWSVLSPETALGDDGSNLPLGLDEATRYQTFNLTLGPDDLVVFYTDALTEAADHSGKLLGESGLLKVASQLDVIDSEPGTIGSGLLSAVASHRATVKPDDDVTMIVLHHNGSGQRRLSVSEKVDVYAKVFGLKSV